MSFVIRGSCLKQFSLQMKKVKLSQSMTESEFDNGYWSAVELRHFAIKVAIPSRPGHAGH